MGKLLSIRFFFRAQHVFSHIAELQCARWPFARCVQHTYTWRWECYRNVVFQFKTATARYQSKTYTAMTVTLHGALSVLVVVASDERIINLSFSFLVNTIRNLIILDVFTDMEVNVSLEMKSWFAFSNSSHTFPIDLIIITVIDSWFFRMLPNKHRIAVGYTFKYNWETVAHSRSKRSTFDFNISTFSFTAAITMRDIIFTYSCKIRFDLFEIAAREEKEDVIFLTIFFSSIEVSFRCIFISLSSLHSCALGAFLNA